MTGILSVQVVISLKCVESVSEKDHQTIILKVSMILLVKYWLLLHVYLAGPWKPALRALSVNESVNVWYDYSEGAKVVSAMAASFRTENV